MDLPGSGQVAWLLRDGDVLASVEVASGFFARSRGLLGRSSWEGAMLLAHTRGVHSLGMRFEMDVAFVDRDSVVLEIVRLRRARMTRPRLRARAVLEAEAGAFERWGLVVGDRLEIKE
jgi:uncharacterized membrane protein (UPF0127 family)